MTHHLDDTVFWRLCAIRHGTIHKLTSCLSDLCGILILAAAAMVGAVSTAAAGTHIPLPDLVSESDFIVVGTVTSAEGRWNDTGVMIFTDYTLDIEQILHGAPERHLLMSFAGGEVDGKSILVTHVPRLKVGSKYLIFGYSNERLKASPIVGGDLGLFPVLYDAVEGEEMIVDYNWYQLRQTGSGELERGPRMTLDESGALRPSEVSGDYATSFSQIPSVVRDSQGNVVPQPEKVNRTISKIAPGQALSRNLFEERIEALLR